MQHITDNDILYHYAFLWNPFLALTLSLSGFLHTKCANLPFLIEIIGIAILTSLFHYKFSCILHNSIAFVYECNAKMVNTFTISPSLRFECIYIRIKCGFKFYNDRINIKWIHINRHSKCSDSKVGAVVGGRNSGQKCARNALSFKWIHMKNGIRLTQG